MRRRPNASTVGADLRRLFGRLLVGDRLPGLPNQNEWQNCKPGEGQPPPRFLGSEKAKKINPFAIMGVSDAHRNLVPAMGPECKCAVQNATATRVCVRAARGVYNRVVQPETLPEGCGT